MADTAPCSGCLDLGKSVGTSLRMSRSRKECRFWARLRKRRLYEYVCELRGGYEHICELCEYEYVCELRELCI